MIPVPPLARKVLGLPPRRYRSETSIGWLALSDGVRLATTVVRPLATGGQRAPAVLLRTPSRAHSGSHLPLLLARLVAESGYVAIVQECRGRYASEGEFTPFRDEARDGQETIQWIVDQPWFDGRLVLAGFGYSAFAAWAALSRAAERVRAVVVAFGARDPHAMFYTGGAFALANGLRWGVGIGEREAVAERHLDLERGLAFRPVREADRVTFRRADWFRQWIDHPRRDAFWDSLEPPIPPAPPPSLLITGWYDPALGPQLDDYAALQEAARRGGSPAPELVVGPWLGGRRERRQTWARGSGVLGASLRETLSFLERRLGGSAESREPVRVFVRGENRWREAPAWPIPEAEERRCYLRSGGRANSLAGNGTLSHEAPTSDEQPDRFTYDPADPVPTRGGCLLGRGSGPAEQRSVESRADVLCYTSPPLTADLEVTGRVRLVLFAASSAPDTDFTAKLVQVDANGAAINLCDGTVRCRWRDGGNRARWLESRSPHRLEIDLWATSFRFRAGDRIRLELSSSNFPRFDRNPNTRAEPGRATAEESVPARQTVFHDGEHPSHIVLPVVPGGIGV